LVRDTQKYTPSAEDVATKHIISKTRDALLVDSPIRKSESIIGLRRPIKEKERVMVEWLMLRRLLEELKMDSDITLLPRLSPENKTETNNVRITRFFISYNFFYF
jgi:hypothetical protein